MNQIIKFIKENGPNNIGTVSVDDMSFNPEFRKACESNACGMFNRCWTCPPHIGEINYLITTAKTFQNAIVYQTIHELEDSYDFEGMMDGGKLHNDLAQKINTHLGENLYTSAILHLGAGGCRVCPKCAKQDEQPCRFPKKAMASLEAYGIDVSQLAKLSGMNYINGQNTVTYFGVIFCKEV